MLVLGGRRAPHLRVALPPPTRHTLLLPLDPTLEAARRARQALASWPPARPLSGSVWSDGSALYASDPVCASAGWAVVALEDSRLQIVAGGSVPGRQTSGRVELCLLVWLSSCRGDFCMVTDNQGVMKGAARCGQGPPQDLAEGPNGDLWSLVRRNIRADWISSHLTLPQAFAEGFPALDHEGNSLADAAAGDWVAKASPPPIP